MWSPIRSLVWAAGLVALAAPAWASYDAYITALIERARTDGAFAAQVREAGPEVYPLVVLNVAGYNFGSQEYKRFVATEQRMGGGDGE